MSFDDFLVEDVTLNISGGSDQWGQPIAATAVTVKSRIIRGDKAIFNREGQECISRMQIYIKDRTVGDNDSATVDTVEHKIINIARGVRKDGNTHYIRLDLA